MVSNLQFQNGAITGVLSGKPLFCFLHSAQGSALPAGQYVIGGPVQDPIYGPVMIMATIGGGTVGASKVATDGGITAGRLAMDDWEARPGGRGGLAMDDWTQRPGGGLVMDDWEARPGGSAFIVSGAPLPGRNCLVVTSGVSELMDGLKTAGSVGITVG